MQKEFYSTRNLIPWAIAAFLLLVGCYLQFWSGLAGDKLYRLATGHLWLDGRSLYDVNLLLITYIYAIPAFLSRHSFLSDSHALTVIGLGATFLCIFVAREVMRYHPAYEGNSRMQWQFMLLLGMAFIVCQSPGIFFEREHIFLIFTFPYILRWSPLIAGRSLPLPVRLTVGVLAAIGFCIKPHCLLVMGAVNLLYLIRERSLKIVISPENLMVYLGGVLTVLDIWLSMPEYFTDILPMALATYPACNRGSTQFIYYTLTSFWVLALTFIEFRPNHQTPYRRDIFYLLWMCLALYVYTWPNNGWSTTFAPLQGMALILTALVWLDFKFLQKNAATDGKPVKKFEFGMNACALNLIGHVGFALVTLVMLGDESATQDNYRGVDKEIVALAEQSAPSDARSFGAISTDFGPWFALARAHGTQWPLRFPHLWMLPQFIKSDAAYAASHQGILNFMADTVAEDLETQKPAIMYVDLSDVIGFTDGKADLLSYFTPNPHFQKAWTAYAYSQTIDRCDEHQKLNCRFAIYYRKDSNF